MVGSGKFINLSLTSEVILQHTPNHWGLGNLINVSSCYSFQEIISDPLPDMYFTRAVKSVSYFLLTRNYHNLINEIHLHHFLCNIMIIKIPLDCIIIGNRHDIPLRHIQQGLLLSFLYKNKPILTFFANSDKEKCRQTTALQVHKSAFICYGKYTTSIKLNHSVVSNSL